MEGEVSKEILLYNILTPDFNEHCKGFGHLAVSNKRKLLDMVVPHLHELLLPGIDVGEVVNHLASLDPQPLRVRVILLIVPVEDGMRGNR